MKRFLIGLFAALFTLPVFAGTLPLTGAGSPLGGTVAYQSVAAQFAAETGLTFPALVDSPRGILSFCVKGNVGTPNNVFPIANANLVNKQFIGNAQTSSSNSEIAPGTNFTPDNSAATPGTLRLNVNDDTGNTNHGANAAVAPSTIVNGQPTCFLWVYDVSQTDSNGHLRSGLYMAAPGASTLTGISNVGFTTNGTWTSPTSGLSVNTFSINPAAFGNASFEEISDFYFDTPTTSPIDVNDHATVTLSKFYNNGPVDQGSTGSNATGTQPCIYLKGGAVGFLTNLGSCGNPTFQSSNAEITGLSDGSLAAGATADRPYWGFFWGGNSIGAQSTGSYTGVQNGGNPFTYNASASCSITGGSSGAWGSCSGGSNDLILVDVITIATSDTTDTRTYNVVAGAGGGSNYVLLNKGCTTGSRQMCHQVWGKFAESCDGSTGNQVDWACPPKITWTTDSDSWATSYTVAVVHNVTSVDDHNVQVNTGTNFLGPTLTATAAKSYRLDLFGPYTFSQEPAIGPPSGENLRFKLTTGGNISPMITDVKLGSGSSTYTAPNAAGTVRNNVNIALVAH